MIFDTLMAASNQAVKILDDNKDKILLGAAGVSGAATVIFACKGTLKAQKVVEAHKEERAQVTEKKDIVKTYAKTSGEMAKIYAPAVVLGATSVCCVLAEHCVMQKKVDNLEKTVAGLSAAYIAVDSAFKAYRKRVVDKYGEEEDKNLRFGFKEETVEVTETDDNGKEKKKKVKRKSCDPLDHSDYAKFFDCTSDQFVFADPYKHNPDWEANIIFLNCTRQAAQQKLERQGYLFLNDVYDMLGIKRTKAGQVVGWIFDPEDDRIDSRIDFGIFEPRNRRTINGYEEECILLDFNVDGVIIDKINKIAEY